MDNVVQQVATVDENVVFRYVLTLAKQEDIYTKYATQHDGTR